VAPQRDLTLRARYEARGEDLLDVESERALHDTPRLPSELSSAPETTHRFVEILFVAVLSQ
jgi:hypothetical protein